MTSGQKCERDYKTRSQFSQYAIAAPLQLANVPASPARQHRSTILSTKPITNEVIIV